MTFQFHSDGYALADSDRTLIEEKLQKLAHLGHRLADESVKVHVKIHHDARHHTPSFEVHAHITMPVHTLDAVATDLDLQTAVDLLEAKLRSQIEKLN